jgi:hypothetical protein
MEGGGSMERPVIGVLNLPARARLKAVVPSRALADEVNGRVTATDAEGVLSRDIARVCTRGESA